MFARNHRARYVSSRPRFQLFRLPIVSPRDRFHFRFACTHVRCVNRFRLFHNFQLRCAKQVGRGGISRAKLHWDRRLVVRVVNHFVVIGVGKLCNTITFVFLFRLASSPLLRIRGGGVLVPIKFEPLFFDKLLEPNESFITFANWKKVLSKFFFFFFVKWMLIYRSLPFWF